MSNHEAPPTTLLPFRVHVADPRPVSEGHWKTYLTDDSAGRGDDGEVIGSALGRTEADCRAKAELLASAPRLRERLRLLQQRLEAAYAYLARCEAGADRVDVGRVMGLLEGK